ncbi:unnamed protein product [Diamesa serratosioi]
MWWLIVVICLGISVTFAQLPPHFTKQPTSNELLFKTGKTVTIDCEAYGDPLPKYRWLKDGEHFNVTENDDRMTLKPEYGSLIISKAVDEDAGEYQCLIKNKHGNESSIVVTLKKAFLYSFKEDTRTEFEAQEGHPFMLSCDSPKGYPLPFVYWVIQTEHGEIQSINNQRMTVDPEGNLWFSNITREDTAGKSFYVCVASSIFLNEYKLGARIKLEVIPSDNIEFIPPTKQYLSSEQIVSKIDKKIDLFCIYGGNPMPEIIWLKNDQPIEYEVRVKTNNYGRSLTIRRSIQADTANYTCHASNGHGEDQFYNINLQIE